MARSGYNKGQGISTDKGRAWRHTHRAEDIINDGDSASLLQRQLIYCIEETENPDLVPLALKAKGPIVGYICYFFVDGPGGSTYTLSLNGSAVSEFTDIAAGTEVSLDGAARIKVDLDDDITIEVSAIGDDGPAVAQVGIQS